MSGALSNLSEMVSDYVKKVNDMKKELSLKFEGELSEIFSKVFEEYPNIRMIKWTQYTPYVNDGDPCEFSVDGMEVYDEECKDDDGEGVSVNWGDGAKKYPEIAKINNLFSISTEILLMAFGDHCQITVDKNGVTVDEYEHE
jgi:hypothetical protein